MGFICIFSTKFIGSQTDFNLYLYWVLNNLILLLVIFIIVVFDIINVEVCFEDSVKELKNLL